MTRSPEVGGSITGVTSHGLGAYRRVRGPADTNLQTVLREQGYYQVVDLGKVITLPLNGLVTTPERIKERPDEIRALARAVLEGTTYLRANRATAVAIIAEWSDVDEALAGELYDLAREIRSRMGPAIRIVALSGFGLPEDRARALEAGFDHHMVKPADAAFLKSLLG